MRQRELIDGVMVHDEQGRELTYSKQAAMTGISQVCMSRITMVAPGMIIVPIIVQQLEKNPFFRVCVVALVLFVFKLGGLVAYNADSKLWSSLTPS
jgi:hypothetical protein